MMNKKYSKWFAILPVSLFPFWECVGDNSEPDDSEESKFKEILSPGEQALSVQRKILPSRNFTE